MSDFMYCTLCGKQYSKYAAMCPECGHPNAYNKTSTTNMVSSNNISDKSWTTLLLLCIFLGFFGIHRFYIGKNGSGIAMILLTIFTGGFVTFFWWIIDIISIVQKKFTDNTGNVIN